MALLGDKKGRFEMPLGTSMICCTARHQRQGAELCELYARKLLEPGWAGELNGVEFTYIKSQLQQSLSLRRRWGFLLPP